MIVKSKIILMLLLISLGSISCNSYDNISEDEVSKYLNNVEQEYEKACKEAGMEVWEFYSDTSKHAADLYRMKFSKMLLNDSLNNKISLWSKSISQIENDTLRRRIEIWSRVLTLAKVNFDPQIIMLQNQLEEIISEYPSEKYSDKEIESLVEQLIELRNAKAKENGYSNYAYMVLQNTGIDTLWFQQLISIIDSATVAGYNQIYNEIRQDKESVEYSDIIDLIIKSYRQDEFPLISSNNKENLLISTLENIGIDLKKLPIQYKIIDLPPGIGGFGNCIDIPNDFRVVAMKELSFYYLLHEIGHGLYWTSVTAESPILKGYEWCMGASAPSYHEAMAELAAKFSKNIYWLNENGFSEEEIKNNFSFQRRIAPISLRLKLVNSLFEIELYKNPNKKASEIIHDLYKKYFFVDKDFSKKPNLIRLQYVSYPVYEQNYLIADIISWQIHKHMQSIYGEKYVCNKEVGEFLKTKLFRSGELISWQQRIKNATGQGIDIEGYLQSKEL